ncbi:sodium:proton antiporter [Dactylosporangium sp. NPDC006015]|uniref:cation:proton antiporter n=1 Tax=Dactylosporangium sp. NPDC006015 TaxID=3154576 RepID=UPI0033AAFD84
MNGVQLLLIIFGGITVAAVAHRRGAQPGLVVVILAAAASFIPGVPRLQLDSELILAVVVPPLLYSATRGASASSFSANFRPIFTLGVTLVVLTTGVAGYAGSLLLPAIGLPAAMVLGAVLAPPDTITTVTHGEALGLPRRVTAILTGESLVNDATALTLFSLAVAATGAGHTLFDNGFVLFLYNTVTGMAVGAALAVATLWLRKRLHDPVLETSVSLLLPFTAFLLAEQVHASGILAVVVAAFSVSVNTALDKRHQYPGAYRSRLQEATVWPVVDFLLETFVFAYIGLQLKFVVQSLASSDTLLRTVVTAAVLLVTVILFRLGFVSGSFAWWGLRRRGVEHRVATDPRAQEHFERRRQWRARRGRTREVLGEPTPKEALIVGWTGMRGILTLAAAAAVPERLHDGTPFPGRDEIQAIALLVTLGTLLIQGMTIPLLVRRLRIDTAAEHARDADLHARGVAVIEAAGPDFDAQREALATAVYKEELDDATARSLIHDVDLRQAAHDTQ